MFTTIVILTCILSFFLLGPNQIAFAYKPTEGFSEPWTLITHIFMHGGIGHLLANCFAFFSVSLFLERYFGTIKVALWFFASGLASILLHVIAAKLNLLAIDPTSPIVGMSGAVFGLFAAFAVFTPSQKLLLFFFIPVNVWAGLIGIQIICFALEWFFKIPVANWAHFGGFLAGIIIGLYEKA